MSGCNKYTYLYILQGIYGHGWEDLTASESRKDIRSLRLDYARNESGTYRVIRRRELN